jgi:hypothetical protein
MNINIVKLFLPNKTFHDLVHVIKAVIVRAADETKHWLDTGNFNVRLY